ncbi:hypothetical protein OGAPHI_000904 [Ogataea philodendri]|uniref:Major facilitator superfamily (MFS) profile domain-containing protein n=1 Tax=Ogataea philodendri TaxID=1378263 RepID=A0A9P8PFA1_9ASCO|nr:uncharacterized protein OGAPHI_000904 [Ogataea philodendri]KAH3670389.1 hypothetical protein OGAPHI_000904 [Ogataea philodendri]
MAGVSDSAGEKISAVLPQDDRKWYQRPNLRKLNFLIMNFILYAAAIGYDSALTNAVQALPQWQEFMDNPTGTWLGFINACPFIGTCAIIFFVPYFCDRFGRKIVIFATSFLIWVGAIVAASAKNHVSYIMGRVMIGFSFACNYAASLYINEMAYPTTRGKFSAAYHSMFFFGSLMVAWIVFGTRSLPNRNSWRIPLALQAFLPTALMPSLIMSPESPRWLASRGRISEAREILLKYHANYEEEYVPLVDLEMAEIVAAIEAQKANNAVTWKSLVATPGNRRRMFIGCFTTLCNAWCGLGIVSSYLSTVLKSVGITSVLQQTLINGFLQLWNWLCAITGVLLVDKLGRRTLFLISMIGLFIFYIPLTAITAVYQEQGKNIGQAIIVFIFLCYGFNDIAFTPLVTSYPAELWPQATRSKGMFSAMFVLNAATFFNIFVNSIALNALHWKYYCVYLGVQVVMIIVIYFTFPETKGHSLEEIALIFDKDEITQNTLGGIQVIKPSGENGKIAAVVSVTEVPASSENISLV